MKNESLVIIAASFEERSIGYSKKLVNNTGNAILIDFAGYENVAGYQMNFNTIQRNLKYKNIYNIKAYIKKPLKCLYEIKNIVENLPSISEISLDITVLPRPYLFLLLEYISNLNINIKLIYSRAKSFGQRMSRGYENCGPISHFVGVQSTEKNNLLILHLGFENIKAEYVWDKYSPHKTIAIIGYVKKNDEWFKEAMNRNKYLLNLDDIETSYISSLNIAKNFKLLCKYYELYSNEYNIIISSIGTKLQAISTYLFAKKYPSVQVAYVSSARYFTNEFSQGIKNIKEFDFNKILTLLK